jgi:hypothetical protein
MDDIYQFFGGGCKSGDQHLKPTQRQVVKGTCEYEGEVLLLTHDYDTEVS